MSVPLIYVPVVVHVIPAGVAAAFEGTIPKEAIIFWLVPTRILAAA